MLSSWRLLSTGQSRLEPGRLIINFGRLVISRFGPLLVRIRLLGVMLVLGVVSLGGAPLALPTLATPEFKEFFRFGRALRVTLSTGKGGVVHLFEVYGCQGQRRILISCSLLMSFCTLSLLRLRWYALVNLYSLLVITMLNLL